MSFTEDLTKEVDEILRAKWETQNGEVVPEAEDIQLGNNAVILKGTVLYADLVDSTGLVKNYKAHFAAEMYKSYLTCACRIIKKNEGMITAFDGDRVMAVYIGDYKNTNAATTALQINYAVQKIINPKILELYPKTSYTVQQAIGVDTGELFVARTGVRGSNDLVWVGKAANYAAKMCSLRSGNYVSYISLDVFNAMKDSAKYGGDPKKLMWDSYDWQEQGVQLYRSSWWWSP